MEFNNSYELLIELRKKDLLKNKPKFWWPNVGAFEVVVGAILTQNTAWKNVEKAINNLKKEDLLEEEKILNINEDKLKELIKPAGFYNLKAKRLKNVTKFIVDNYGDTEKMAKTDKDTTTLRNELLSINGVGKETGSVQCERW